MAQEDPLGQVLDILKAMAGNDGQVEFQVHQSVDQTSIIEDGHFRKLWASLRRLECNSLTKPQGDNSSRRTKD